MNTLPLILQLESNSSHLHSSKVNLLLVNLLLVNLLLVNCLPRMSLIPDWVHVVSLSKSSPSLLSTGWFQDQKTHVI